MSSKVLVSVVVTALSITSAAARKPSKPTCIGVILSDAGAVADGLGIRAREGATLTMDKIAALCESDNSPPGRYDLRREDRVAAFVFFIGDCSRAEFGARSNSTP